jgi:histidyl-tRNA synthetase
MRPEGTASIMRAYIEMALFHYRSRFVFGISDLSLDTRSRRREDSDSSTSRSGNHRRERSDCRRADYFGDVQRFIRLGTERIVVRLTLSVMTIVVLCTAKLWLNIEGKEIFIVFDCQKRMKVNPLRVLDCKNEKCQETLAAAPQSVIFSAMTAKNT